MSLDVNVREIIGSDFQTIEAGSSAADAASLISQKPVGCLVVVENDHAVGIVTEQDIVTEVTANKVDPSKIYVRDIMSTPVIAVRNDNTLKEAAEMMATYKVHRLVVVEGNGAVAGVITTEDLASWISKDGAKSQEVSRPRGPEEMGAMGPYQ